ncbi:MAG: sugar transferase [Chloroflexota bacterium]
MIREIRTSADNLLLVTDHHRLVGSSYLVKRLMDLVIATGLVIVLAPIMLIIALAIRYDSPGPALFIQQRVGSRRRTYNGQIVWEIRPFNMYKFRTMRQDADQSLHEQHIKAFVEGRLDEYHAKNGSFKLANDQRITRVGAFLRKTSLDELPQLFNVLRGEMSLVGPRPVPIYEAAAYETRHRERLAALPGMTGLWQVTGRSQVSFEDMVRLDIEYVRNQSLWLDIKILAQTAGIVISGFGGG